MRALIVKTSSMGDVIHTLPALTDAINARDDVAFDWLVEEGFAEIPRWHPGVREVTRVALRRWRRSWRQAWRAGDLTRFWREIKRRRYDWVLDVQGLAKSAAMTLLTKGSSFGYDRESIREPGFSWVYGRRLNVDKRLHAIERIRRFFASALGYEYPGGEPDYGIRGKFPERPRDLGTVVFFHGTTWPSKRWPLDHWRALAAMAAADGWRVRLSAGSDGEEAEAKSIAAGAEGARVLPRGGLTELAEALGRAQGFVGVDTGLSHLCGALNTPGVTIYGPSDPKLTAPVGAVHAAAAVDFPCAPCKRRVCNHPRQVETHWPPCFATVSPQAVWRAFKKTVEET